MRIAKGSGVDHRRRQQPAEAVQAGAADDEGHAGQGPDAASGKKGKRPEAELAALRRVRRVRGSPATSLPGFPPVDLTPRAVRPNERSLSLAVKIRLMRVGKKKQPTYRVVVADGRSPARRPFHRDHRAVRAAPGAVGRRRSTPSRALALAAQGRAAHRAGAEAARDRRRVGRSTRPSAASPRSRSCRAAATSPARWRRGVKAAEGSARRRGHARAPRRAPKPPRGRGRAGRPTKRRPPKPRPSRRRAEDAPADDARLRTHARTTSDRRRPRRRLRDDDDFDDEVGAEGNRIVGARARAASSSTSPATSPTIPTRSRSRSTSVGRRGLAARAREPRRHGSPHRQARSRDPGGAPARARRRQPPTA